MSALAPRHHVNEQHYSEHSGEYDEGDLVVGEEDVDENDGLDIDGGVGQ